MQRTFPLLWVSWGNRKCMKNIQSVNFSDFGGILGVCGFNKKKNDGKFPKDRE